MQRRLTTILAADIAGFSRLTGADEEGTVARLRQLRAMVIDPAVAAHHGRLVKTTGDGALVEFGSVVDAVRAAVAIQEAVAAQESEMPPERRIALRIGINLGDVVVEADGDLMGDGVNIAARLEGVAEVGGICLSAAAYDQVRGKVGFDFADMGEKSLKNIARPVRAWRWTRERAPGVAAPALPPDKPSIAVLPFLNMSADAEQEYFSDGITEDIITDLSKVTGLLVIARNSTFTYKGRAVDIRVVGRELGARAVLEGSVRRAGNRVRITAQLIDAESGAHLWADRFDRDLDDIFAVQDEVTRKIVDALKINLSPRDAGLLQQPARQVASKAHDLFLMGREILYGPIKNREVFERATDLFAQAIEADPSYGAAHAGCAFAHILNFQNHWTEDWRESEDEAARQAGLALAKSPEVAFVHLSAGMIATWQKDHDRAAAEAETALRLNPNYAPALSMRGIVKIYGGTPLDAIPDIEQAIRLDPIGRQQYIHFLGSAYLIAGQYEAAAAQFRERIRLVSDTDLSRGLLAVALGHLGKTEEAGRVWAELATINPSYSFAEHLARLPLRNPADADRLADGLRKAGIAA
jgi:adenylate cyclase